MLKRGIENSAQSAAASSPDTVFSITRIALKMAGIASARTVVARKEKKSRAYSYNLPGTFLGNNERR